MNVYDTLKNRCYQMGKDSPDKIPHDEIMKKVVKVIVELKINDEDAFSIGSRAFSEGFEGLNLS